MNTALKDLYGRMPAFPEFLRERLTYLTEHRPTETVPVPDDLDRLFTHAGNQLDGVGNAIETFLLLGQHGQHHRTVVGALSRLNNYLQSAHPTRAPFTEPLQQAQGYLNRRRTTFTDEVCSRGLSVADFFIASHTFSTDMGSTLDKINLMMLAVATPLFDNTRVSESWVHAHYDELDGQVDNAQLAFALKKEGMVLYYHLMDVIRQADETPFTPCIETPEHVLTWTLSKGTFEAVPELAKLLPLSLRQRVVESVSQLESIRTLRDREPRESDRLTRLMKRLLPATAILNAQSYAMVKMSQALTLALYATLQVQWEYLFYHLDKTPDIPAEFLLEVTAILNTVLEG